MLRYLEQFPVFMYRAAVKKLDQKISHDLAAVDVAPVILPLDDHELCVRQMLCATVLWDF